MPARLQFHGGSALAAELLLQQSQADRADRDTVLILNEMVHDARVVRIGGKHVPPTIRRWMGDLDRLVGRRHARRGHHEFHRQDAVQRFERSAARRRTHQAHRRQHAPVSLHHRGSDDVGSVRGPASIRGRRPRSRSTSTPVTRATTRWDGHADAARGQKEAEDAAKKQD